MTAPIALSRRPLCSQVLQELRELEGKERAAAAEFAADNQFDGAMARELNRAYKIKQERPEDESRGFSDHPGDILAFKWWRAAIETQKSDEDFFEDYCKKGLQYAHTDTARARLQALAEGLLKEAVYAGQAQQELVKDVQAKVNMVRALGPFLPFCSVTFHSSVFLHSLVLSVSRLLLRTSTSIRSTSTGKYKRNSNSSSDSNGTQNSNCSSSKSNSSANSSSNGNGNGSNGNIAVAVAVAFAAPVFVGVGVGTGLEFVCYCCDSPLSVPPLSFIPPLPSTMLTGSDGGAGGPVAPHARPWAPRPRCVGKPVQCAHTADLRRVRHDPAHWQLRVADGAELVGDCGRARGLRSD